MYINGLIDSGKAMVLSPDDVLNIRDESQEERVQRNGRAGRVELSVVAHLGAGSPYHGG